MGTPAAENVRANNNTPFDAQLRRYPRSYRKRLKKLARSNDRLRDLVYTFPALAFTLAAGHGNPLDRAEAVKRAIDGAPLRDVAASARLDMWTRRLPPEAFDGHLQRLPRSEAFGRTVVNLIPEDAGQTRMWLAWVIAANSLCGEQFALWVARRRIFGGEPQEATALAPLAAYAWYAGANGGTDAGQPAASHGLIREPWRRGISFDKAISETRDWLTRIMLEHCQAAGGSVGRWHTVQRTAGFRFVPLRTPHDLEQEGDRMANCVASYAPKLATGLCLIYGIRRGNEHVATLEIRPHWSGSGAPSIAQLLGPGNEAASDDIVRAVETWLARQGKYPYAAPAGRNAVAIDEVRWRTFWTPYQEAIPAAHVTRGAEIGELAVRMHRAVDVLARIAG